MAFYVNGYLYMDEFSYINITDGITYSPDELFAGEYWVIGDNRNDTWWGVVYKDEIMGKLVF